MNAVSLAETLDLDPSSTAVVDFKGSLTWAELDQRTHAVGRGIEALGLAPRTHVALAITNRYEFVECAMALTRAGFTYTPVKSNWTATEMGHLVTDAKSQAVITDVDGGRETARQHGIHLVDIDEGYEDWITTHLGHPIEAGRKGFRIPYTSGTTGRPKGVTRTTTSSATFEQYLTGSAAYARHLGLPGHGRHLMAAQLFHGAPMNFGMGAFFAGAELHIMKRWNAAEALAFMAEGPMASIMVPTMFRQLLALPEADRAALDTDNVLAILHGGEACPIALKQAMIDWIGPRFTEYYGFTEGGMATATTAEWIERPGTVGKPADGLTVTIVDDDGNEVPTGELGTVYFRRPEGRYFAYTNDSDKTEDAHRHDDSFTVGDHGYVDEDGYLYLSGRTAEMIVAAGVNIYPAEIEEEIFLVDGVRDACVVGGPDDDRGEQPVAFISITPGFDRDEVIASVEARCAEHMAGYKRPRRILVADAIPRDPTGKVVRRALREPLWEVSE